MPLKLVVRRWVSFAAQDFGKDGSESFEDCGIPEAARFLAAGLQHPNVSLRDPENRGDWAYAFTGTVSARPFEVLVASTDEERPYVACITFTGRLFERGQRLQTDLSDAMNLLCALVHAVLQADHRISNIRWHTDEGWETPNQPWQATPETLPPVFT